MANKLSKEVSTFLDEADHPLRKEIEELRLIIINAVDSLTENIKWNGPNYCDAEADRVTMKIYPPKQIQLIFHRGAKKLEQLKEKIIQTSSDLLVWKENDRAIASIKNLDDIDKERDSLTAIVKD